MCFLELLLRGYIKIKKKEETERLIDEYISRLSGDDLDRLTKNDIDRKKAEYADFKDNFKREICYLCQSKLSDFDEENLCLHQEEPYQPDIQSQ